MNTTEYVHAARNAHQRLRSRPGGASSDPQAYSSCKAALDQLWAAAERHRDAREIRRTLTRLTADAEFFAGRNDAEGFCNPVEVWQQYDYIERAMVPGDKDAAKTPVTPARSRGKRNSALILIAQLGPERRLCRLANSTRHQSETKVKDTT